MYVHTKQCEILITRNQEVYKIDMKVSQNKKIYSKFVKISDLQYLLFRKLFQKSLQFSQVDVIKEAKLK